MTEEATPTDDPRDALSLKLVEQAVDASDPWKDDVLGRKEIASRLTNIVQKQQEPFVISLHGAWGSGKTFMLKRWQQDLENQKVKAIYFNAWEEDLSDDPLLTIAGQLSEYFDNTGFKEVALDAARVAGTLFIRNLRGIANKATGASFDTDGLESEAENLVGMYLALHATKDRLKERLTELSNGVFEQSGYPLVFIIDEMDRCRPTFATELLERVKHIFDVPNIVFVLGVNRDELCSSLQSVYGQINADVYLRRFFDMEFNLPQANAEAFGQHLLEAFGLKSYARDLISRRRDLHVADNLTYLERSIPTIWSALGLSLRDIDHCVRLTTLMCKSQPKSYTYPHLLGVLAAIKITNLHLFKEFVCGDRRGSEVMDYVDGLIPTPPPGSDLSTDLASLECLLYYGDYRGSDDPFGDIGLQVPALQQLRLFVDGNDLTQPEYLSQRTRNGPRNSDRVQYLVSRLGSLCAPSFDYGPRNIIRYLANLIDLGGGLLRR